MEELTVATVEWDIERAVVPQLREEKHKLRSNVNYLNLELEKREISILESFRRNQEALEAVEDRMTAMEEELARLEMSKCKLDHDMALLEAAASGDAFALEEEELECLEMKRQLGIVVLQINHMQTAIDLVAAQFALEMSNREAYNTRMEEGKCACDTQPRQEIVSAVLVSTQGSLKTDVQRLDSSLKQTEFQVSEMLKGVKALTVAVEELELEKCRLVLAASQAEMRCTEKEQELVATQGDLTGLRFKLMEAELHEKSLSGQMEELTGAKLRWEVERADAKRVIEEIRQEKDRLGFGLTFVNVEVEERQRAIFDSFRRSQQALERVEARLITMEQELGGLDMSEQNLENDLAFLDSAANITSVAFEEMEHKYLQMQRRVENAEVQMYEMQAVADSVMAQVVLGRDNWEINKRRMEDENDARETELRDDIAAAELKLAATEGSLKVAVENVEDLGLSIRGLEKEILKLSEDAKRSLLKFTEQQQQIDALRGMSMALKAECTEADDSIAVLNQVREQYLLAEASWRLEQELLTRKLEELKVSTGQLNSGNVSNEGSGVSKSREELSQCFPKGIPGSEDQKHFEKAHLYSRQKQEIQVLRAKISEKDRTILSAKNEMQVAIANLKEAELEMDKVHRENHRLTQIQLVNKSLIESLSLKFKTTEEELLKRDIKIEGCEAELQKVVRVMSDWETKMRDVEIEWRKEKVALAQELTEAKLVANEKRTEAGALLQKFQDGQATLKEAEDLVDALVKANENAKYDALDWKTETERLGIVQGWWMPERDKLVTKIARLETDMHTQKQDIWIMCKEEVNGLVATMDLLLAVDKELFELKNDHQRDLDHLAVEMKAVKDDLVDRLLDVEGEMMSSFEDMQTVVYELPSKTDRALKVLPDLKVVKEQRIAQSLHTMNSELNAVENEREKYQTGLVVRNEQLEMVQTLADELEIAAAEARQAAERNRIHAEEKEEEARILERSVEELESTVYALESQLDIVKRESERQRVAREDLEKELEALKREMGFMQVTIDSQEAQTVRAIQRAETSKTELDRIVIEMKNQQIQARKSVESLQQECAEKDVQLRSCKAHIAELTLGAEKQASENQQKLKTLEAMLEHPKVEERKVHPAGGSVGKAIEKSTGKVKGAGSSFKCIGSALDKQKSSEMDEELSAAKKRIKELETVAASRQKEVFMLNTKLAEAESMTHDVVRDLLGVKMDIASYATLLNQQQVQRITEQARRRIVEAQQKEDELDTLRDRLNEFIEERESWLEEINGRLAQAVTARVSAEKLRLRDEALTAENDKFREDNHALRKKLEDVDDQIKKLSGQQNLQQRIHHHAKTKDENNSIRLQNEDLSGKLRRMEILFTRVNDEVARYRTAEGKSPFQNFDEEARLQKKLQETEENRSQLAETLIGLCKGIMQVAGIQRASRDLDPSAAMMALHQLRDRLESLERELSDCKLKTRIAVEKRRLSDLRDFHSPPVKAICTNTNFTANQRLPSPVSSSR